MFDFVNDVKIIHFNNIKFKILDCGKSKFETTIIEALHINNRPSLNKQSFTRGSSLFLISFNYISFM